MNGFSILMFIFALGVFLAGLYIFTGHKSEILLWKVYDKNPTKEKLRNIGKWTMISSLIIFIIGIIGLILNI